MPWGEGPAAELRGLHLGGLCPKSSSLGHRTRNCPGKVFTSTSLGFCRWPVPNLPAQRPPGVAQPGPPAELHAGEGPTLETPLPRGVGVWMAPSSLAQGLGSRPPALDRQGGWGSRGAAAALGPRLLWAPRVRHRRSKHQGHEVLWRRARRHQLTHCDCLRDKGALSSAWLPCQDAARLLSREASV